MSYLSSDNARGQPEAGPQERLSKTGDNLANVIQYLSEEHPRLLDFIFDRLRERIPKIQKVTADQMPDGRLLLQLKDAPFCRAGGGPLRIGRYAQDARLYGLAARSYSASVHRH